MKITSLILLTFLLSFASVDKDSKSGELHKPLMDKLDSALLIRKQMVAKVKDSIMASLDNFCIESKSFSSSKIKKEWNKQFSGHQTNLLELMGNCNPKKAKDIKITWLEGHIQKRYKVAYVWYNIKSSLDTFDVLCIIPLNNITVKYPIVVCAPKVTLKFRLPQSAEDLANEYGIELAQKGNVVIIPNLVGLKYFGYNRSSRFQLNGGTWYGHTANELLSTITFADQFYLKDKNESVALVAGHYTVLAASMAMAFTEKVGTFVAMEGSAPLPFFGAPHGRKGIYGYTNGHSLYGFLAPRAMLLLNRTDHFIYNKESLDKIASTCNNSYALLGKEDKFQTGLYSGDRLDDSTIIVIDEFLKKNISKIDFKISIPSYSPKSAESKYSRSDLKSKSKIKKIKQLYLKEISNAKCLMPQDTNFKVIATQRYSDIYDGYIREEYDLEYAPNLFAKLLMLIPKATENKPTPVLMTSPGSSANIYLNEKRWAGRICKAGYKVAILDSKITLWKGSVLTKEDWNNGTDYWVLAQQRLLDYLETRKDVDINNIAIMGHSWGGPITLRSAIADTRIKVAIASSGLQSSNNSYQRGAYPLSMLHADHTLFNAQHARLDKYPKSVNVGGPFIEPEITNYIVVPKPLLIMINKEDYAATPKETKAMNKKLKKIYGYFGVKKQASAKLYPGPHSCREDKQTEAIKFLDKYLK